MNPRTLLAAGAVAGPLFLATAAAQMLLRDGFDITHQPISLLSLGDAGWIQITNFVVAGVLVIALALGLRQALTPGRGSTWVPRLMGLHGLGLVAGGVFIADPGLGFPPGTPDSIPDSLTWHGTIHAVAPPLAFLALVATAVLMALRYHGRGQRGWATYTAVSAVISLLLAAWPDMDTASWRLALGLVVGFAWVTAMALRERSALGLALTSRAVVATSA